MLNEGTITSVKVTGTVNGTGGENGYAGGIVAWNKGTVEKCANAATVSGTSQCNGGIVGDNPSEGIIDQCYNTGSISSSANFQPRAGGITGWSNGTISNCYNKGQVSAGRAGGISGALGAAGATPSVNNCYNTFGYSGFAALSCSVTNPSDISVNEFFYNTSWNIVSNGYTAPAFTSKALSQTNDLVISQPSIWELRPGAAYPTLINNPE